MKIAAMERIYLITNNNLKYLMTFVKFWREGSLWIKARPAAFKLDEKGQMVE